MDEDALEDVGYDLNKQCVQRAKAKALDDDRTELSLFVSLSAFFCLVCMRTLETPPFGMEHVS